MTSKETPCYNTRHCHMFSVGGYMRGHSQWTGDADYDINPIVAVAYNAGQTPLRLL